MVHRHIQCTQEVMAMMIILEPTPKFLKTVVDQSRDQIDLIMAIDHLQSAHLLEGKDPSLVSRRSAVRKVARLAAAGVILPVVSSIAAPTPAMALSGCSSSSSSCSS